MAFLHRLLAGDTTVLTWKKLRNLTYPSARRNSLLTNLETPRKSLAAESVLSGQQELEKSRSCRNCGQLRQRIMLRCKLHPLTKEADPPTTIAENV